MTHELPKNLAPIQESDHTDQCRKIRESGVREVRGWNGSCWCDRRFTVIVKVAGRPDQTITGVIARDAWNARSSAMVRYNRDAASGGKLNGAFVDYVVTPEDN
jgi:hypothetical protein